MNSVARIAIDTQRAAADSNTSEHEWWQRAAPVLESVFDPEQYPLSADVGTAVGQNHDSAYEFGLARVLDGLAQLIEERSRRCAVTIDMPGGCRNAGYVSTESGSTAAAPAYASAPLVACECPSHRLEISRSRLYGHPSVRRENGDSRCD
ncbi:TetR/AcrR family transcriptional regulator C-terminal domain-containing protein [Nocardia sp. NPDC059228]|uniref:TetR/AcrR family transcriptional regulator C-terminal domain-containing protein n=1 Tax=Nocardia sp. NPDC059228 TaxID=3346777 RepID=UPI0036A08A02